MPTDLFIFEFAEPQILKKIKDAKAVCASCPVRTQCLEEALQYSTTRQECIGVWGGLTWRERQKLVQQRELSTNTATPLVYRDGKYRRIN
jgi:hypothetical protein